MLYYLKNSLDIVEIGKEYPQIQDFDLRDPTPIDYTILDKEGLLPSSYCIRRLILHKNSKVSDFLSSSPMSDFLFFHNKVVKLLSNFHLAIHQVFDFTFIHRSQEYKSHEALYFIRDKKYLSLIDWEKSRFYKTKDWHNTILEEYKFSNWDEMRDFDRKHFWGNKEFGFLYKIKIHYTHPFDLVNFRYFGLPPGYVCTEKVKNLIENEGFTGFRFEPVDPEYFV
jgi:hypothetical protein